MSAPRPSNDPARALPSAVDMERCVISCMMQAPDFAVTLATERLKAEDFAVEAHGLLYDVVGKEHGAGRPVDPVSITQIFYDRDLMKQVEGPGFIIEIHTASPNPAHVTHYADTVQEKAKLRRLLRAAMDFERLMFDQPEPWRAHATSLMDAILQETAQVEGRGGIQHLREHIHAATDDIEEAYHNRGHVTRGIATGFTDLDRMCRGYQSGENIAVGGATSMGKSAFVVNVLEKMALAEGDYVEFYKGNKLGGEPLYPKRKVLLVTLEMSGLQIAQRMLLGRSGITLVRLHDAMLSKAEFASLGKTASALMDTKFYLWDAAGLDIADLEARLKEFKQRHPDLCAVAVDHCGLLRARAVRDSGNATAVVNYISPRLKILWKTIDVVGFTLWQLNREATRKGDTRPRLANLKDSGAIENDADRVLFPYRPAYGKSVEDYDNDEDEFESAKKEALLIVAKNRGGPTGELPLKWFGEFTRFESVTERLQSLDASKHQPKTGH